MLKFLRQPRWITLIAAVPIGVVLCLWLSNWQWNRYEGRKDANAVITHNRDLPTEPINQILPIGTQITDETDWRMVTATGTYDAAAQMFVRRRPLNGQVGFWVATPLVTNDGKVLVVNRGWAPSGSSATSTPDVPPPPTGQVTVTGRLQGPTAAPTPRPADMPAGQIAELDTTQIGSFAGTQIYSAYINLETSDPAQAPGLTPIPLPELDDGPHLSYSMQWIAFAVLFIVGLFLLIRREITIRREEAAEELLATGPATADVRKSPHAATPSGDNATHLDESTRLPQDSA